jgi:hypothetical protein
LLNFRCTTVSPPEKQETPEDRAEIAAVKKSFDTLSQAMVDGKLETVYSLVSTLYKTKQSYEDLVKEYNENRDSLIMDFKNAVLLTVAVERNQATARVKFGTGDEKIIDFIKEGNTWKWNLGGGRRIRNSPQ